MKDKAIVLGAGQGLGSALCKKLSEEGYEVIGINRSLGNDEEIGHRFQADLSDSEHTKALLQKMLTEFGAPQVVIHNTAQLLIKPFLETSEQDYFQVWQSTSQSLFSAMQVLLPAMVRAGQGTVIVSGATASLRGGSNFSAFASAKFALRGLTQSLAREFQPQGIHIAHVLLDGIIDTVRSRELHSLDASQMMLSDDIASQYLNLIRQPSSTWTHELDLRPSSERF